MTDEEFVQQFYKFHMQALDEVYGPGVVQKWDTLPDTAKERWVVLLPSRQKLIDTSNGIQEFIDVWWEANGLSLPAVQYARFTPQEPIARFYRRFWELVVGHDWAAMGAAAPTGELAMSIFRLRASGRKFIIQGYIDRGEQSGIVCIKFLDDQSSGEIDKTDFDSVAMKVL